MTFQPYQSATEEMKRQSEMPARLLKQGLSVAGLASVAAGSPLVAKILPFLSRFIPQATAIKGLSKIEPRIGKFINSAIKMGMPYEEAREFIKNKLQPEGEEEEEMAEQDPRAAAIAKFQQRQQQPQSELSRESLMQQFQQGQQQEGQQGKAALLSTMQEITRALRQMRGQGG